MKKNIKVLIVTFAICTISILGLISYSSKIINPFIGINAIIKMELSDEKVEKISEKPVRYISRGYDDFITYMESKGYIVEQMGRGFDLKKGKERILLVAEGFLKYEIFTKQ
ncbi:MAG: hypothetical protein KIB00_17650 [Paeniclostridium sordellii]|uniref:hypothetical protein n=1 Tax=Paraclostridium sordellii TaxID=1505 RepID=UPI0002D83422|nr:hypothetical protein [Paeniclostridium sordellii]MBS6025901.1 hypothetical protein [Paeniclostridium sordellii]TAN64416.1 hypothetical protein WS9_014195 [Paeniclostridium sordellii 8483]CEK35496.1 hypothetical protein UMC2_38141 [[Clostridium] sordellii] [Paeniclostridium sordellii]